MSGGVAVHAAAETYRFSSPANLFRLSPVRKGWQQSTWPWKLYVTDPDARGIGTVRYPRVVPKDGKAAGELKKRTLTNLYNERPAWLANAHRKLDEAVFAAYGWPANLSDDDLLAKLLELNLSRAGTAGGPPDSESD